MVKLRSSNRILGTATVFLSSLVGSAAWGAVTSTLDTIASDSGKLEEIVVTAQRRSESLQETPVAVSVISGDQLAAKHVTDISNLGAVTPSVAFETANNAQAVSNIQIRGIGTVGNNRAFEGSVGVFVDGVYLSRAGQLLSTFLDYDNLQILKGPQGTLFGKNTTAGALLLTSTKPQFTDYDGSYEVTGGNYGNVLARVASNIPVSDKLALRVAKTLIPVTTTTRIVRAPRRCRCSMNRLRICRSA